MRIGGLQKVTLLDYPGKVACTVFLPGCNLRCPYCHNPSLVLPGQKTEGISPESLLAFLNTRRGKLDGVCVTGGEPTLHRDLPELLGQIRDLGFSIKLDTNGTNPEMLASLLQAGALDYVAMDIKNSKEKYAETVGIPDFDITPIERSVEILKSGAVPFEFRTTVVKELHGIPDIEAIAKWISPAENFFLQQFVDSGDLIGRGLSAHSTATLEKMRDAASEYIPNVQIRGTEI